MSKSCCVILCAGLSSRMGSFKPLLPIKNRPAIAHLISSLREGGVDHIVVVTGFRAEEVINACKNQGSVTFMHNPDFASTGMLESAKIGFSAIGNEYSRILFTPADVPLTPASIVRELLNQDSDLVYPSCDYKKGHPVFGCPFYYHLANSL